MVIDYWWKLLLWYKSVKHLNSATLVVPHLHRVENYCFLYDGNYDDADAGDADADGDEGGEDEGGGPAPPVPFSLAAPQVLTRALLQDLNVIIYYY